MWILRKAGLVRHGVRRENRIISRRTRTPCVRVTRWILFERLTEVQVLLKEGKRRRFISSRVRITRWIRFERLTEVQVFLKEGKRRLLFQMQALEMLYRSRDGTGHPWRIQGPSPPSRPLPQRPPRDPSPTWLTRGCHELFSYNPASRNEWQGGNGKILGPPVHSHRSQQVACYVPRRERERESTQLKSEAPQKMKNKKTKNAMCYGFRGPLKIVETVNIYFRNYALLLQFLG